MSNVSGCRQLPCVITDASVKGTAPRHVHVSGTRCAQQNKAESKLHKASTKQNEKEDPVKVVGYKPLL